MRNPNYPLSPSTNFLRSDMPFVYIPDGRGTRLFYEFQQPLDHSKQTILLLPGFLSNLSFNAAQFSDNAWTSKYNLLGIEMRYFSSRSTSEKPTYELDISVQAAEIAFVLNELNMPAVHVFAPQSQACTIAKRLAYLFPEKVLSMTMAGLTNLYEGADNHAVYSQILEAWLGEDTQEWNEATMEVLTVLFDGKMPVQSSLCANNWASRIREQPTEFFLNGVAALNRKDIPHEALAQIRCPVLLIQGTPDGQAECAEWYTRQLSKAKSTVFSVWGAPHAVSITNPNIVSRTTLRFLSQNTFDPDRALRPVPTNWEAALKRLPGMVHFEIDVAGRDPRNPLSYSVVTEEEMKERCQQVESIKKRSRDFLAKFGQEERFDGDDSKIPYLFADRHHLDH